LAGDLPAIDREATGFFALAPGAFAGFVSALTFALAGAGLAADFFTTFAVVLRAAGALAAPFRAVACLAGAFFAIAFLTVAFLAAAFLATAGFFATAGFAADFFADALTAAGFFVIAALAAFFAGALPAAGFFTAGLLVDDLLAAGLTFAVEDFPAAALADGEDLLDFFTAFFTATGAVL
jgi:hypothetical protein